MKKKIKFKKLKLKKSTKKKIKKFYRKHKIIIDIGSTILIILLLTLFLGLYFKHLNKEANKVENNTDSSYLLKDSKASSNGLFFVNVYDQMTKYFKSKNTETVTYKIENETFYLTIIKVYDKETKETTFDVIKISDPKRKIYARINFMNIKEFEYKTGDRNKSTVIHLISNDTSVYYALSGNNYYMLGDDIESISYKDEQFYYVSYNKKYKAIETVGSCTEELKASIDNFKLSDVYYNYGEINFLSDYYQKLSSDRYTVEEKCNELGYNGEE